MLEDQIGTPVPNMWGEALKSVVSALPVMMLAGGRNTGTPSPMGGVGNAISRAKSMLGSHPFVKICGAYLIADGAMSIISKKTDSIKAQIPRVIRAGIGLYLIFELPKHLKERN
ncbi:MAG: hypothetical protein PHX21_12815 [bacterium]|nr:hypothetical protein [bacterium]